MSDIDGQHLRLLEAILFASPEPLPERALVQRLPEGVDLPALLAALRDHYAHRGVNLVKAGNTWAFRTAPDLAGKITLRQHAVRKLGRAMIETLAVIAYHQPVTRAEVEEIRGVGFNRNTLDVLFEAGWIRPRGRRRTPGRPMTWGTTDAFLDNFGLESLDDLPGVEELKAAGLLDKRPAIEAYGMALAAGGASSGGAGEGDDEPGLFDTEEAVPEPLEPGGG